MTFCLILVNNQPTDSLQLWEKHKHFLSEDFLYRAEQNHESEAVAYNRALLEIQDILYSQGCTLKQYRLPEARRDEGYESLPMYLRVELGYNRVQCTRAFAR